MFFVTAMFIVNMLGYFVRSTKKIYSFRGQNEIVLAISFCPLKEYMSKLHGFRTAKLGYSFIKSFTILARSFRLAETVLEVIKSLIQRVAS